MQRCRIKGDFEMTDKDIFCKQVSTWSKLPCGLPYTYICRYYPKHAEIVADEKEWYSRKLIWSFKAEPSKKQHIGHYSAISTVIWNLAPRLKEIFNSGNINQLTLVCIPASTIEKTHIRYDDFYKKISAETGIQNGSNLVGLTRDYSTKHDGGIGLDFDDLYYDTANLKGRNIILFDDIITSGHSMCAVKNHIEACGATVIAALSIGKTCYTRDENCGISIDKVEIRKIEKPLTPEEKQKIFETQMRHENQNYLLSLYQSACERIELSNEVWCNKVSVFSSIRTIQKGFWDHHIGEVDEHFMQVSVHVANGESFYIIPEEYSDILFPRYDNSLQRFVRYLNIEGLLLDRIQKEKLSYHIGNHSFEFPLKKGINFFVMKYNKDKQMGELPIIGYKVTFDEELTTIEL